jgi:hypothetical protein
VNYEINKELLVDLAKLTKRYKPEEFKLLAEALSDPEFISKVVATLEGLATLSDARRKAMRSRRKGAATSVTQVLDSLREEEPEKHGLIQSFVNAVEEGAILKRLEHLRSFASNAGMKLPPTISRKVLVSELVRHLANLPLSELKSQLSAPLPADRDFGAEYRSWVRLILGHDKQ